MADNNSSNLDYEPLGSIRSSKGVSIGLYIFAGVLITAGIIVNFAVISSSMVFAVFVFLAALSVLSGVASAKGAWYWGEEKFTIANFLAKPVTYGYDEIDRVYSVTEGPAVTIMFRMKNGKEHGLTPSMTGTKEFLEYLSSIQDRYK